MHTRHSLQLALFLAATIVHSTSAGPYSSSSSSSSSASTASSSTCFRLTDADAPIYDAVPMIPATMGGDAMRAMPLHELLAPIDAAWPWLSACVASTDALPLATQLLVDAETQACLRNLSRADTPEFSDAYVRTSLCPLLQHTALPCLDTVVINSLHEFIQEGGACCQEMESQLHTLLGQDIGSFLTTTAAELTEALCTERHTQSERTSASASDTQQGSEPTSEMCGFAVLSTLLTSEVASDPLQLLEIPNNEVCAAMTGLEFTTTQGSTTVWFTGQRPVDACFAPWNQLMNELAELPVVTASANLSALFADDACLPGADVMTAALDETGLLLQLAMALDGVVWEMQLTRAPGVVTATVRDSLRAMDSRLQKLCLHLAHSETDCTYASTTSYTLETDSSGATTITN